MIVVPIQAVPAQVVTIQLSGQNCDLNIYQKFYSLTMDVLVNNNLIIGGVTCWNLNRIVRSKYLGFVGDFAFFDTQGGGDDPTWDGLGTQFQLLYFAPDEVDNLVEAAHEANLVA
jgi:hypothetical protein